MPVFPAPVPVLTGYMLAFTMADMRPALLAPTRQGRPGSKCVAWSGALVGRLRWGAAAVQSAGHAAAAVAGRLRAACCLCGLSRGAG